MSVLDAKVELQTRNVKDGCKNRESALLHAARTALGSKRQCVDDRYILGDRAPSLSLEQQGQEKSRVCRVSKCAPQTRS